MLELNDELYSAIMSDLEKGDDAAENSRNSTALKYYLSGLEKVPDPKTDWEISLHIYTAMGDLFINMEQYENAVFHYQSALNCPDGLSNGYIWLGLGQAYYELGDMEKAKDALKSAYMLEGDEIFQGYDLKYYNLIKEII
ncbi:lipopolysaccharide assembly protein LapB [Bacteroides sp. 224]|uniref:tetratricopeptide repeat protein n=1 Tax=Bacteroides sp. 224 TaxID=2302936 RepID=UPI0013D7FF8F|nr:tetratricopeptide repeat protein [Bacteroides sp. 224]NDV66668.1 tetratricopeptide repeat protein [Bacteroides sp. 224]